MRYSYEFKKKCIELYRQGQWTETPDGIKDSSNFRDMVRRWVRNYKVFGYNGLVPKQKGRKPRNSNMKKVGTRKPPKPNESEYEELIRLRAENEYMRAEIEVIKKEIALREEKEAARLKAKKQRSSKNSAKKDTP